MRLLNLIFIAPLIVCLLVVTCAAQRETPTPQPVPLPLSEEQRQLVEAERANQAAQTEYYLAQTAKLKEPGQAKGFWTNIRENPASVLGALAAAVAFISFIFNYRATLIAQENTQFYEALKRFGDKDSPALRASSAAILAQMAGIQRGTFTSARLPWRNKGQLVFFETARNQLAFGFLIEENLIVILSIYDAFRRLLDIDPLHTTERLFRINERMQDETGVAALRYFVSLKIEAPEKITEEDWRKVGEVRGGVEFLKRLMMMQHKSFAADFVNRPLAFSMLTAEKQAEELTSAQHDLRTLSFKWDRLLRLLSIALEKPSAEVNAIARSVLVLVACDLRDCTLHEFDLRSTLLGKADLDGSDLSKAKLQGAWLRRASLTGTKLYGAEISDDTDFSESNWWQADFFDGKKDSVDEPLVRWLIGKYGMPVVDDEPHPSVVVVILQIKDEQAKKAERES